MLADLAALILAHYDSLLLLMLAGACFVLAGMLGIFIWRRRDVVLGEDEVPTWTEPTVRIPLPPKAHYRREDDDTQVITPGIPGALPPQAVAVERFLEAVDDDTTETLVLTPVLREAFDDRPASEVLQRIVDNLRGPVCPNCGGPFGNCSCYSQNSSSDNDVTQVVDLCPLTTQDIPPLDVATPIAAQVATFRNPRQETQDLTVRLDQIRDRERVA